MKSKKSFFAKVLRFFFFFVIFSLVCFWQMANVQTAKAYVVDAELLFTPATDTVTLGDYFDLVASVDPGSNDGTGDNPGVNAVKLHITFDRNVLQVNDITVNTAAFSTLEGYPVFDNVNGTVTVIVYTLTPEIIPTNVATINFRAISTAINSPVVFTTASDAAVNDGNGTQVVVTRTPAMITVAELDTTAPTVTGFVIPTNSASLTVPITTFTATDAAGVTGYMLTESATAPGSGDAGWSGSAPTEFVFATAGSKTLYAWAKDAAGNVSTSLNDSVIVDMTAPTGGAFTINSGDAETTSTSVILNIICPTNDWSPVEMAFGNSASPTNWTACASTTAHTLTTGDGTKTVYMRFRDGGETATTDLTDTIELDTTAPTGGAFTINSDAAETTSTSVTLNITCPTDTWSPVEMAFGNSENLDNWTTCASTVGHTLTVGSGTKTVYMRFRDGGGAATVILTDTIFLNFSDNTAPIGGAFTINSDAAETNSTSVTLNINCPTDDWSPVEMAFGNSASPTNWTACASTAAHTLTTGDGTKTVYMRFRDGGETATADLTDTIQLNTAAPILSYGSPSGTLPKGTTSVTVAVMTDENATCKYSTQSNTTYASMTGNFTNTGAVDHYFTATKLRDGHSYSYYVRCADSALNFNTSDYLISFAVSRTPKIIIKKK